MRLSRFLDQFSEQILAEWDAFAQTLTPAADAMSREALRDHAREMLRAIALDIETPQTEREREEKSQGHGRTKFPQSAAAIHGTSREGSGFALVQLTAEFRALRASVLRLWLPHVDHFGRDVHEELMRFNEAVDQALAESAATFSQHAGRTRDRFLAILGHDLRNPLSAISATGQLLERSAEPATAAAGQRLTRSAATLSTMVADLLEYSRTQLGGTMPMAPAPADMRAIAEAALHDTSAAHPDCRFETAFDGDTSGRFDAVRMQQLIGNLLANAAQYRAPGTNVVLRVASTADEVTVAVANQGPTIPPESLQTIFSAMVQLPAEDERQARPRTSLGLGLFIARETALAHGGSIDVSSDDVAGTVFTVRVPRAPREAGAA